MVRMEQRASRRRVVNAVRECEARAIKRELVLLLVIVLLLDMLMGVARGYNPDPLGLVTLLG